MAFRSQLEAQVAKQLGPEWTYEPCKRSYWIPKTYTPDFVRDDVWIEVKGYFRQGDIAKYLAINEELRYNGEILVFVLQNPNKRVRKGAKLTMAGWCEKHGIPWYDANDLPPTLIRGEIHEQG